MQALTTKIGYSREEAATATSLSVRSIDYLLAQGELKGVKINRRVVISADSLHRLIERGLRAIMPEAMVMLPRKERPRHKSRRGVATADGQFNSGNIEIPGER